LAASLPQALFTALVNLGTHCKGALFLEGNQFISEKLTLAIDKISKNFNGFYFGRYDLRRAWRSGSCRRKEHLRH
jgi:hypothetical protein